MTDEPEIIRGTHPAVITKRLNREVLPSQSLRSLCDSCGNNCLSGLTVTNTDLGFGAAEENTNYQDLPEDILINDGPAPWNRYGWYYNDVTFTCSDGTCMMP